MVAKSKSISPGCTHHTLAAQVKKDFPDTHCNNDYLHSCYMSFIWLFFSFSSVLLDCNSSRPMCQHRFNQVDTQGSVALEMDIKQELLRNWVVVWLNGFIFTLKEELLWKWVGWVESGTF